MKKTLLTIFCAMTALFGMAQTQATYNEQYVVTTNGVAASPKDGTQIVVDNGNGTINFTLKDFYITAMGSEISVGDLTIQNMEPVIGTDGLMYFSKEGTFTVPAEKLTGMYAVFASNLTNMPVKLTGKLNDEKLYAVLELESNGKIMGTAIQIVTEIGTDNFAPAGGKVYTEQLLVTINGETSEPQTTDVTVIDNGNGTINFELKNFFLVSGESSIPVGSIIVENIPVTEGADGLKYMEFNDNINIQPGDAEGIDFWVGPNMGDIPLDLKGKMNDEKLYVTIDIDMQATIGQICHVQLGTDDFLPANAKVYTEQLLVTINGETSDPQMTDVTVVDNGNSTINFVLKNFILSSGGTDVPVGNIVVENIDVAKGKDGLDYFSFVGDIMIQPGDKEGVEMWMGPMICASAGAIPLNLQGKMNDEKLYVTIDIDMQSTLGQIVYVQLGTDDFVLPTIKSFTEPYYVTIMHEQSSVRTANIEVEENADATINFTIKDLVLEGGELTIPVGDLTIHYLETENGADGKTHFSGERSITIPTDKLPTDSQELQAMAMMGAFSDIPTTITGWYDDNKLYADINAEKTVLGYTVTLRVQIGVEVGDVNCDGTVDIADAVTVLNAMAGQTVAGIADVNGDKNVDIADFVTVLNIMAGL